MQDERPFSPLSKPSELSLTRVNFSLLGEGDSSRELWLWILTFPSCLSVHPLFAPIRQNTQVTYTLPVLLFSAVSVVLLGTLTFKVFYYLELEVCRYGESSVELDEAGAPLSCSL